MESKPGWKTSEAWITALISYVTTDMATNADDVWIKVAALVVSGMIGIAYIWSRVKTKEICVQRELASAYVDRGAVSAPKELAE